MVFLLKEKAFFVRDKLVNFLIYCFNNKKYPKIDLAKPYNLLTAFYGEAGLDIPNPTLIPKLTRGELNIVLKVLPKTLATSQWLSLGA